MSITRSGVEKIGINLLIVLNLLSYEQHVHDKLYVVSGMLGFIICFIFACITRSLELNSLLRSGWTYFFIVFCSILSAIVFCDSEIYLLGIVKLLVYLCVSLFLFSLNKSMKFKIFEIFYYWVVFCAAIGGPIYFFDGLFFWERTQVGRGSSIFHDPNFAAAIFGLAFLYGIFKEKFHKTYECCYLFVILIALVVTFSKTGILAVFISWLICYGVPSFKRTFVVILIVIVLFLTYERGLIFVESNIQNFRVSHGFNARDKFAVIAIDAVRESPICFHKPDEIYELIRMFSARRNVSFHNTYLDASFAYGIIYGIGLFSIVLCKTLKHYLNEDYICFSMILFVFIMSFSITIIPGSVGILSIIFVLLLSTSGYGKNNK